MKRGLWLCVPVLLLLAACGAGDFRRREQPVPLRDMALGTGSSGAYTAELLLREGEWFDSAHVEPGGGIYGENFRGSYELVLKRDGETLDSRPFGEGANVSGEFEILFDDYNGDGAPDFAIGQWGGTNYNVFTLYTIREDALSEIGEITTTEGKYVQDFSMRFRHENGDILTNVYDMELGEQREIRYHWDGERYGTADW